MTHVAVAFDNPIRSFRNALFAGYKSDEGVPPELLAQFDLAEEAMRALGLTVWSMKDHEADDALATAAARWGSRWSRCGCSPRTRTWASACAASAGGAGGPASSRRNWTRTGCSAKLGVSPESVPDLLALVGDAADGIPGLPGFGDEGRGGRCSPAYGHLEAIPPTARRRGRCGLGARTSSRRRCARTARTRCSTAGWPPW